jgi:hypothetical protein
MAHSSFMKMFNVGPPQKSKQSSFGISALMQSKSKLLNLIGNFSYNPRKDLLVLYYDDGEQVCVSAESFPKKTYKVSRIGKVFSYSSDKELFDALWKIKIGKI